MKGVPDAPTIGQRLLKPLTSLVCLLGGALMFSSCGLIYSVEGVGKPFEEKKISRMNDHKLVETAAMLNGNFMIPKWQKDLYRKEIERRGIVGNGSTLSRLTHKEGEAAPSDYFASPY